MNSTADESAAIPLKHNRRIPLVIALGLGVFLGGALLGAMEWGQGHDSEFHGFLSSFEIGDTEENVDDFADLLADMFTYVAIVLALWFAAGFAHRRWRSTDTKEYTRSLILCAPPFLLLLLNAASLVAFYFAEDADFAQSTHALSVSLCLTLLWRLFGFWPLRVSGDDEELIDEKGIRRFLPTRVSARVLTGAAIVYLVLFTALSWLRYMNFFAALQDLGMYTQQLWGNLNGHWFLCSSYGLPNDNMLAEHFMPIVVLLSPLYLVWADPRSLLFVQTLFVALAAWPIYLIALHYSRRSALAAALAGSYLLHPLLQTANLYDFHPDALVPFFAAMAFWALLRKRWALYWPMLVLALMCKEDFALATAMLGLYALCHRRWVVGSLTFLLAGVWFVVAVDVIIPHFMQGEFKHIGRYAHLVEPFVDGDVGKLTLGRVVAAMVTHPFHVIGQLFTVARIGALLKLFGPVLALSLLGPLELLLVAPALAANLLALSERQHAFQLHYPFMMLPFVYISAAAGMGLLLRRLEHRPQFAPGRTLLVAMLLSSALFCFWHGETPLSDGYSKRKFRIQDRYETGHKLLRTIPADAAVSAQTCLASHLTNRRYVYQFPEIKNATVVMLDAGTLDRKGSVWPMASNEEFLALVESLLTSGEWGVTANDDGYVVLTKGAATAANAATLDELRLRAAGED